MDLRAVGSAWWITSASNCSFSALMLAASVRAMVSSVYKCASLHGAIKIIKAKDGFAWICCFQVWGPNWVFNTEICWYAAPSKEFSWIKNKTGTCRFAEKMGPTIAVIRLGSTTLSNWSCNCLRCCRGEALSAIQSARSLAIWLTSYF